MSLQWGHTDRPKPPLRDQVHRGEQMHTRGDRCPWVTELEHRFDLCSICRGFHPSDERHPCE